VSVPVRLPRAWEAQVRGYPADDGPTGADWVASVPRLVAEALERWDLAVSGEVRTGWTAVVVPVLRGTQPLALKVGWPHRESALEHLALRTWGGRGAVRLVAALPSDGVLLLERLDADDDLTGVWVDQACEVIGGVLHLLHVPAPPQVQRLADHLAPRLERMPLRSAVPRRIVQRTAGLARELLADGGPEVLLHTDLHFANLLRRPGGDHVAIDPKPLAGHPGFDILPVLRNRTDEMGTGASFRWSARHRVSLVAQAAGIDEDAALAWSLLRAGLEVGRGRPDAHGSTALDDGADLTTCIALTKALDD
jgi:streptomycin 6-kinase